MKKKIRMTVNGDVHEIEVEPRKTLLAVLRDQLGLTGTKEACGTGDCGACTVLLDGKTVTSCLVLAVEADGREVTTIEGISRDGDLHPVQKAMVEYGGVQCGFCTPGFVLSAVALLNENPDPTEEEIRQGLAGNFCRCTGYTKIVQAIRAAAKEVRKAARGRSSRRGRRAA